MNAPEESFTVLFPTLKMNKGYLPARTNMQLVGKYFMKFETTLRKQHLGVWFLCTFTNTYQDIYELKETTCVNLFLKDVYKFILIGIIVPELTDSDGKSLFVIDKDQTSEVERIKLLK